MFGHRLSHLNKLIRNLNHHLGHRTSCLWQHFDSLFYQIFEDLSSMGATPCESSALPTCPESLPKRGGSEDLVMGWRRSVSLRARQSRSRPWRTTNIAG